MICAEDDNLFTKQCNQTRYWCSIGAKKTDDSNIDFNNMFKVCVNVSPKPTYYLDCIVYMEGWMLRQKMWRLIFSWPVSGRQWGSLWRYDLKGSLIDMMAMIFIWNICIRINFTFLFYSCGGKCKTTKTSGSV